MGGIRSKNFPVYCPVKALIIYTIRLNLIIHAYTTGGGHEPTRGIITLRGESKRKVGRQ